MKLKPAKRKKYCSVSRNQPFPITKNATVIYTGNFNGFCVVVDKPKEINCINSMGYFGKGNLSRSCPHYNSQTKPVIIRKRQYLSRKFWLENDKSNCLEPMIVVNDSDTEENNYADNLFPELAFSLYIKETLNLTLEEAFFLLNELECLKIKNINNKYLESDSAWKLFANAQENFIQNYAVYHYFRAKNWVVKPGLKFGGDFLLYKQGPPFYHASYVVIIQNLFSDSFERNPNVCQRSSDWASLIGLHRLTETISKEVVICQVIWPKHLSLLDAKESAEVIKSFSINTILMRRWVAKQERL